MYRAHALGADNPLAAFHGRPEPLEAYFDTLEEPAGRDAADAQGLLADLRRRRRA